MAVFVGPHFSCLRSHIPWWTNLWTSHSLYTQINTSTQIHHRFQHENTDLPQIQSINHHLPIFAFFTKTSWGALHGSELHGQRHGCGGRHARAGRPGWAQHLQHRQGLSTRRQGFEVQGRGRCGGLEGVFFVMKKNHVGPFWVIFWDPRQHGSEDVVSLPVPHFVVHFSLYIGI